MEDKNYSGFYSQTLDFVIKHKLEKQAEKVFGKDWEQDSDIAQIQELLDSISEGYDVKPIEENTARDVRADDYIHVFKKSDVKYKVWLKVERIVTTDDDEFYEDIGDTECSLVVSFDSEFEAVMEINEIIKMYS